MKNKIFAIRRDKKTVVHFWIALCFCCFGLLQGCTESITIETDNSDPTIVIYGIITDEYKFQEIRITRSSPYFDDEPNAPVKDALVVVTSSENDEYHFIEDPKAPGYYYSENPWAAQVGVRYDLAVKADFDDDGERELYEAFTEILYTPELDSIKVVPLRIMGHNNYHVNIYGKDPDTEDYYLFKALVDDSLVTRKMKDLAFSDDIVFNGEYINGITVFTFDDISEWKDDSKEQRENSIYIKTGDVIEVETCIIPRGYYDFIFQCFNEQGGENPMFGGPASNITSNISNGGVGYFAGYSITRLKTKVE